MKIKKILLISGVGAVCLCLAAFLSLNWLIKRGIQVGLRNALGVEMEIADIDVRFLRATDIRIDGLTVYNPQGFEGEALAKIPKIYVDYEFQPLFQNRMHCTQVELNIEEIAIVKNQAGEVNLNRLKAIAESGEPAPAPQAPGKEYEVKIDRMVVTFDHVKFKDFSARSGAPEERIIPIGLNREEFLDLSNTEEIVRVVVLKTVVSAGLANLGVAVEKVASSLKNVKGKGMETLKTAAASLKGTASKIKEKAGVLLKKLKKEE